MARTERGQRSPRVIDGSAFVPTPRTTSNIIERVARRDGGGERREIRSAIILKSVLLSWLFASTGKTQREYGFSEPEVREINIGLLKGQLPNLQLILEKVLPENILHPSDNAELEALRFAEGNLPEFEQVLLTRIVVTKRLKHLKNYKAI